MSSSVGEWPKCHRSPDPDFMLSHLTWASCIACWELDSSSSELTCLKLLYSAMYFRHKALRLPKAALVDSVREWSKHQQLCQDSNQPMSMLAGMMYLWHHGQSANSVEHESVMYSVQPMSMLWDLPGYAYSLNSPMRCVAVNYHDGYAWCLILIARKL